MLQILKDFVLWVWCWLLDTVFGILDILVDVILVFVPDLGANQSYANALEVFISYLQIANTFFPLNEFILLYGIVKTLELSIIVFRLIWRTIPATG